MPKADEGAAMRQVNGLGAPKPEWTEAVAGALVINLDKDTERWQGVRDMFRSLSVPDSRVHRLKAVEMTPGWKGCTASHLAAVDKARALLVSHPGKKYVLIAEDDLRRVGTVEPDEINRRVVEALKEEPDILYLSMSPNQLESTEKDGLHRVKRALSSAGMLFTIQGLDLWKRWLDESVRKEQALDVTAARNQSRAKVYGFFPALFHQAPGFSNIEGRAVNYDYLQVDGLMLDPKYGGTGIPSAKTTSPSRNVIVAVMATLGVALLAVLAWILVMMM